MICFNSLKQDCHVRHFNLPKHKERIKRNLAVCKQSNKLYDNRLVSIYAITETEIPVSDVGETWQRNNTATKPTSQNRNQMTLVMRLDKSHFKAYLMNVSISSAASIHQVPFPYHSNLTKKNATYKARLTASFWTTEYNSIVCFYIAPSTFPSSSQLSSVNPLH